MSANPDISRGESQPGSRYGLVLASFLVLATAGAVWTIRAQKSALKAQHRAQVAQIERLAETTKSTSRRESQHAVSLLIRAFLAERQTTYSALAETRAVFAGQTLKSHARITRRPDAMAIAYVKGDRSGVTLGYNQRWAWRQKNGAPMQAYAELAPESSTAVARRMALLLDNYWVSRVRSDKVAGRDVEVIEIRPLRSSAEIDGAKGPGKNISVDVETGLPLETESFDHQWQSVMKSSLSQVNFSPRITDKTFASLDAMTAAAKRKDWMAHEMGHKREDVARMTGWQPPTPKYLPPGFAFDSVGAHHCADPNAPAGAPAAKNAPLAAMARYTDGLNTLSVFAMPEPTQSAAPEQVCDFGPGTLVSQKQKGGFIIAVGDLPAETLRRVAKSTTLQKAAR